MVDKIITEELGNIKHLPYQDDWSSFNKKKKSSKSKMIKPSDDEVLRENERVTNALRQYIQENPKTKSNDFDDREIINFLKSNLGSTFHSDLSPIFTKYNNKFDVFLSYLIGALKRRKNS